MPGSMTSRHQRQGRTRKLAAASLKSLGNALAPAMTLKRMYHCVPRIISGLSQIFGESSNRTIRKTATGNRRLAGKAARNWAIGWMIAVSLGRSPTKTPIGTQITDASTIRMATRSSVRAPSLAAVRRSSHESVDPAYRITAQPT